MANSVLGFIRRTVGPKNPELFSKLYKILVRLLLVINIREFFVYFLRNIAVVMQLLANPFEIQLVCIIYISERMTKLSLEFKM